MSLRALVALKKAAASAADRRSILTAAIDAGETDPRLWLQRGERADFDQAARLRPDSKAAPFMAAVAAALENAPDAFALARKAAADRSNVSAQALAATLALETGDAAPLADRALRKNLPAVTGPVKGMLLAAVERHISFLDPADRGAPEREDILNGPLGWLLDRFDDLSVAITWGAARIVNVVVHRGDPARRAAFRAVISGDVRTAYKRPGAVDAYRLALVHDPACEEAVESLIRFHLDRGDVADARSLVDRYTALRDGEEGATDPTLLRWRADLAWFGGAWREAADGYRESAARDRLAYFPPYRHGLCALRLDRRDEAVSAFTSALSRINPHLLEERLLRLDELTA